jgi:serine/threonine-protein kinase
MKPATESSERDASANALPPDISADAVQAALEKILASHGFANADRLSRFLRFSVSEYLTGQTDRLKESLLGVEVFGRKPSYDPRVDAVVRTEAVKLRARIRDYYETEGAEDALIIDLPKGGYIPKFRLREKEPIAEAVAAPLALPGAATPDALPDSGRLWPRYLTAVAIVVLVFGLAIYMGTRDHQVRAHGPIENAIVVLPFADLSPDRDQEYFCDGMTEEIIDSLTKIGGFRVVARTSAFAFKGKQQDIREIGKKLNVGYVLEGSVRKDGSRLRVTAQLNSVNDGYHLWSETYERELKDVFTVQDEISRSIVNTLEVRLASSTRPSRPAPGNLETYDLYLQGRYHWGRWRTEGAEKAIQYYEQSISKDPKYAPAYAGVADSYTWLGFFGALPPSQAMPKARQFAQKAIELDPTSAEAHTALAFVKALYDFDWPGAQKEFQRAIQSNPNYAQAHFGYSIAYLCPTGKTQEGLREMQLAKELDPLSLIINTYLGLTFLLNGQTEAAASQYKSALTLDPNFTEAHLNLSSLYLDMHDFAKARAELDKIQDEQPQWRTDLQRANILAIEGRKADALALVHKWENPAPGDFVRPSSIATVYSALNDRDNMVKWLEKAYADRDGMLAYMARGYETGHFRNDPQVKAVFAKIGLP